LIAGGDEEIVNANGHRGTTNLARTEALPTPICFQLPAHLRELGVGNSNPAVSDPLIAPPPPMAFPSDADFPPVCLASVGRFSTRRIAMD
jgi:hypothetical protein